MTTTLCVSGQVLMKAGSGMSSAISGATLDDWINEAECYISLVSKNDWVGTYAGLNTNFKKVLQEAASNLAAIYAVSYNMDGYGSRVQAEDTINILYIRFSDCMKLLENSGYKDFLKGA